MCATLSLDRPTVLVIHDDGEALDQLTRLFEASGFEVITAVSGFRAQAHLERTGGERAVDLVVVPWDAAHPTGGEVYRWSLQRRYDLRDGFVFLAAEAPPDFDRVVAGRCLAVAPVRPAEIVRVAIAAVRRRRLLEAARDAAFDQADDDQPTLLLADDEPVLLMVMADLLAEAGYAVVRVDSGHAAIRWLEREDADAIVTDWNMDDGNGADLYRWIVQWKPWLADRVVFLADVEGDDAAVVAPGRPMFRKGQDFGALATVLREIVRQVRQQAVPEPDGRD
jgi:DNA-binding response OmpR family regulator